MATKSKSKTKAKAKTKPKLAKKLAIKPTKKPSRVFTGSIKPLEDRVIVRIDVAAEKTAGGLYIPTNAGERPNRGEIVAAGPGRRNKKGQLRPLDVKKGDRVLFPQYAGTKINVDSEEFLILREDEVLGIVT